MTDKSLYDRPSGVFTVAAVVDHFSNAVLQHPVDGKPSPTLGLLARPLHGTRRPAGDNASGSVFYREAQKGGRP